MILSNFKILKSKRKCKCRNCWEVIDNKYKVKSEDKYYHLSCYYKGVLRGLERMKEKKKQLNKYKKYMILDNL